MNRGDYSRISHKPFKHYTGVVKQQGRVDDPADSYEHDEIAAHLRQTQTRDVIGSCGFPETGGGFEISFSPPRLTDNRVDVDLTISPGRGYVDGILCELEATPVPITGFLTDRVVRVRSLMVDGRELKAGQWVKIFAEGMEPELARLIRVDEEALTLEFEVDISRFLRAFPSFPSQLRRVTTYTTQPDYPNPPPLNLRLDREDNPSVRRTDLVYLVGSKRHVTAIEDPDIREVALGGPDTTTRVKTVWQVKVLQGVDTANWEGIGDAIDGADVVMAMAAINNKLFAVTANNLLWWRDPVGTDVDWAHIGDAIDGADVVVAMAAINNKLFAATNDGRLWWRDPVGTDVDWEHIGDAIDGADAVVAMAAINGKLFAATDDDKLWRRDPVDQNVNWEHIGHANAVVAMAAINNKLFAATEDGRLWWRDPVGIVKNCEDQMRGWPPPRSGGRLSTEAVRPPAAEDPCLIAPGGGYRGLENRLYRVEIHEGGRLGEATFLCDRDNGSIEFLIEEFKSNRQVKVKSLGRDQTSKLGVGTCVVVLDNDTEKGETAGTAARIREIVEEDRLLTQIGRAHV
jgi:hypothetical protein